MKSLVFVTCLSLLLLSCGSKKMKEEEEKNPFYFTEENFGEFWKQVMPVAPYDTTYSHYAVVSEFLEDSLMINNDTEKLIFGVDHGQSYNSINCDFKLRYYKNDSLAWKISNDSHRFFPLLEAMKQIRKKTKLNPKYSTNMEYGSNKDFKVGAEFFKDRQEWEIYIDIVNDKDSLLYDIILSPAESDSLILKMDAMKDYLMKSDSVLVDLYKL